MRARRAAQIGKGNVSAELVTTAARAKDEGVAFYLKIEGIGLVERAGREREGLVPLGTEVGRHHLGLVDHAFEGELAVRIRLAIEIGGRQITGLNDSDGESHRGVEGGARCGLDGSDWCSFLRS